MERRLRAASNVNCPSQESTRADHQFHRALTLFRRMAAGLRVESPLSKEEEIEGTDLDLGSRGGHSSHRHHTDGLGVSLICPELTSNRASEVSVAIVHLALERESVPQAEKNQAD